MVKGIAKKKQEEPKRLIIKGNGKAYYNQKVIVNYAPISQAKGFVHPQMRDMVEPKSTIPTFNNDKVYYTPCFINPSQQNDNKAFLNKHNNKMQQYAQIDQQQILVPKPKDRHYCHICQQRFEDYYQHVNQKIHHQAQKKNRFQRKIRRLCQKFQKKNGIKTKQQKQQKQNEESDCEQSASHFSCKQNVCMNECSEIRV